MKKLMNLQIMLLMILISSVMIIGSCKKNDDTIVEGDKTALNALIVEADALANAATTADYPQSAIDDFKSVLATVKTTTATPLTQVQIDNLTTQLTEAMATFESRAYGFIDETLHLNAGWHFDEGTGTTATAYSTTKHVATFFEGNTAILTDVMSPSWVAGVKGGNAVYLNKGAHLQVPYTTSFLPVDLTISVWVKPDELYEHNYIISQNYWNGYKLQTQGGGKPFFTYKKVDGGIVDADNETDNSVKVGQWNHLVVSINGTTNELKFYVNGTLTKTWTEVDKGIGPLTQTLTSPDPQPFMIGCVATDAEVAANMSWADATNLGYFKGAIDELKIYNIALVDGQVSKLYNDEKP